MKFNQILDEYNQNAVPYDEEEIDTALYNMQSSPEYLKHREYERRRNNLQNMNGDNLNPNLIKWKDSEKQANHIDKVLSNFKTGTIMIDFAEDPKSGRIKLDTEFTGDCIWLFDARSQRFNSLDRFIDTITFGMYSINAHVDKTKVRENLFDPDSLNHVVGQIKKFIKEYPKKARSLSHTIPESDWDMEIKFKRSLKRLSGAKEEDDTSSPYVIYPAISGENKWGRVIAPEEQEQSDPSLWKEMLNQISSTSSLL